mmetsp:Transcript_152477/g.266159  ORF Transcript_152477/g.266159 Transcript_152477/m.266159 type:complete len:91 (-) Transcript_152477:255-527(-)
MGHHPPLPLPLPSPDKVSIEHGSKSGRGATHGQGWDKDRAELSPYPYYLPGPHLSYLSGPFGQCKGAGGRNGARHLSGGTDRLERLYMNR